MFILYVFLDIVKVNGGFKQQAMLVAHNRIEMERRIFALAGLLARLIANLTIGYQSVKALLMNPV